MPKTAKMQRPAAAAGGLPVPLDRRQLRRLLADEVERLIAMIDAMDGDHDIEDDELGEDDDPAEEADHPEEGGDLENDTSDEEPWLATPCGGGYGGTDDREQDSMAGTMSVEQYIAAYPDRRAWAVDERSLVVEPLPAIPSIFVPIDYRPGDPLDVWEFKPLPGWRRPSALPA